MRHGIPRRSFDSLSSSSDSAPRRTNSYSFARSAGSDAEALYAARMESARQRRRCGGEVLERSMGKASPSCEREPLRGSWKCLLAPPSQRQSEPEDDIDSLNSYDSEQQRLVEHRDGASTDTGTESDDDTLTSPKKRKGINWIIWGRESICQTVSHSQVADMLFGSWHRSRHPPLRPRRLLRLGKAR